MTAWVRLWEDMPTDPKWRVIARKSGQPVVAVIAMFNMMMIEAGRAAERGSLVGWRHEDAAAALDMDEADIEAIWDAMQTRVVDGQMLSGWERRQPKREDSSAQRVAKHRENKRNEEKRAVTHGNAPDTEENREEEEPPNPLGRGKKAKSKIDPEWKAPAVADLPEAARARAEQWSAEAYRAEAEAFVNYWLGEGKMKSEWNRAWYNRVTQRHSAIMRDQKFGNLPAPSAKPSSASGPFDGSDFAKLQAGEIDEAEFDRRRSEKLARAQPPPERRPSGSQSIGQLVGKLVQQELIQ